MHLYPDSVILEVIGLPDMGDFENVQFIMDPRLQCPTPTGR